MHFLSGQKRRRCSCRTLLTTVSPKTITSSVQFSFGFASLALLLKVMDETTFAQEWRGTVTVSPGQWGTVAHISFAAVEDQMRCKWVEEERVLFSCCYAAVEACHSSTNACDDLPDKVPTIIFASREYSQEALIIKVRKKTFFKARQTIIASQRKKILLKSNFLSCHCCMNERIFHWSRIS